MSKTNLASGTAPKKAAPQRKDTDGLRGGETVNDWRKQHGDIRLRPVAGVEDGEVVERRAHVDCEVAWVSKALKGGKLTDAQAVAADRISEKMYLANGSPSGRSSIDFSVRGSGGSGNAQAAASADLKSLRVRVGWVRYSVLHGTLHMGEVTGQRTPDRKRWRLLVEGLQGAVDLWRMES